MLNVYAVDVTTEWGLLICDKTVEKAIFEEVNFSKAEELDIISIKKFDRESHIKQYHACMNLWTPEISEILKAR